MIKEVKKTKKQIDDELQKMVYASLNHLLGHQKMVDEEVMKIYEGLDKIEKRLDIIEKRNTENKILVGKLK